MSEKIVLVDGHSMMNRAFYGVPPLTNSKGLHTNAIFGFLNILLSVLDNEKPQYLMVAFDLKAPTFRHRIYEAYKGTRKAMPDELREQIPVIKDVLSAMQIPIMTYEGFEADDILGTMAKRAEAAGLEVCILSGDRDLLQLATEKTKIKLPHTKGGKTETEDFFAADVLAKYQVSPAGIIELKALMGDSSDNIPGVPKVGEKTATELVKTYGCIENLKLHIEEISKKSIRETLTENFDMAELSKVLATINTAVELPYSLEDGRVDTIFTKEAYDLLKQLEFKNILSRFDAESVRDEHKEAETFRYIDDFSETEAIFERAAKSSEIGAQLVGDDSLVGIALSISDDETAFVKVEGFVTEGYILDKFSALLQMQGLTISMFGLKKQLHFLDGSDFDGDYRDGLFDTLVMSYLLNPLKSDYSAEDVAQESLGLSLQSRKQLFDKLSLDDAVSQKADLFLSYACYQAYVSRKARTVLLEKIKELGMQDLLMNIELPLIFTLWRMEREGIIVKKEDLAAYGEKLSHRISELEDAIYEGAGEKFNINSPKQLGEILFEKMKLPGGKKTKTGYSTAADVLEKLAADVPFVADILEYRGLAKLKSTYADGLAGFIREDGRIHSTFHQTITATGRLSSADPNLQNIPIRTEIGRQLRRVFVPKEGYLFVDADYSQIELRLLASMSEDEKLIEAYGQEQDIHRITASQVFKVPFEEVTPQLRRNAKAVNFGIVYGISSFGLSQDLSIGKKEAQQYIENYFLTYPGVKAFLDRLVSNAKKNGYVETMYGRRRPVPELSGGNFMQKQFGERVAMNAPIQGTAADIMKIAMIAVDRRIRWEGLKSRLLLQVHDELLIETAPDELETVKSILREEMSGAARLPVRLEADVQSGPTWYEAH